MTVEQSVLHFLGSSFVVAMFESDRLFGVGMMQTQLLLHVKATSGRHLPSRPFPRPPCLDVILSASALPPSAARPISVYLVIFVRWLRQRSLCVSCVSVSAGVGLYEPCSHGSFPAPHAVLGSGLMQLQDDRAPSDALNTND